MSEIVGRRHTIGGSDARIIMGDDQTALLRLWREKRGEVEPEDLSDNLIVQLGTVTEELNRAAGISVTPAMPSTTCSNGSRIPSTNGWRRPWTDG
jgi:hypothetical protein